MVRAFPASILAALGLAVALAGCAPGPVIDRLPGDVGLPAGTPLRPESSYQYPAVHDMPPVRSAPTMSEDEQLRLEKELTATRDRQEGRAAPGKKAAAAGAKTAAPASNKQATPVSKKTPATVINVPPAGAATNP